MPIYFNNEKIDRLRFGNRQIKRAYHEKILVFENIRRFDSLPTITLTKIRKLVPLEPKGGLTYENHIEWNVINADRIEVKSRGKIISTELEGSVLIEPMRLEIMASKADLCVYRWIIYEEIHLESEHAVQVIGLHIDLKPIAPRRIIVTNMPFFDTNTTNALVRFDNEPEEYNIGTISKTFSRDGIAGMSISCNSFYTSLLFTQFIIP